MKFGKVDDPSAIDFNIPADDAAIKEILKNADASFEVYIGCAKWNKTDLKDFYPKGTKDELIYYAQQFNSIEMNSLFYNMPRAEQVVKWKNTTPEGFKFFPKITQSISHMRRLNNVEELTKIYCDAISHFEEKLGICFLQLHENFGIKGFDKLKAFVADFPKVIPLAVEVRNKEWYLDKDIWNENVEKSSPLFSAYLIEKLNSKLNLGLHIPKMSIDHSATLHPLRHINAE